MFRLDWSSGFLVGSFLFLLLRAARRSVEGRTTGAAAKREGGWAGSRCARGRGRGCEGRHGAAPAPPLGYAAFRSNPAPAALPWGGPSRSGTCSARRSGTLGPRSPTGPDTRGRLSPGPQLPGEQRVRPGRGRAPTGSASPQCRRPTGRVASRRPQPLAATSCPAHCPPGGVCSRVSPERGTGLSFQRELGV